MTTRSGLCVLLLSTHLVLGAPALANEPVSACETPLNWRIGEIDPRFDMDAERLAREVRQAARIWNDAAGKTLLRQDNDNGFRIHLVHDERQQQAREVRRLQDEYEALQHELERQQDSLEADQARQQERRDEYNRLAAQFQSDLQAHNQAVAAANRGRTDERTARELRARGEELTQRRQQLAQRQQELTRRQQAINRRIDTYNALVERVNHKGRQLEQASREAAADSGEYRADITRNRGGDIISIRREIDIYFFFDRRDLRWTLAHELGHALGIAHVPHPEAIMHAAYHADDSGTPISLHEDDIRALNNLCD